MQESKNTGLPETETLPNGTAISRQYDRLGRITAGSGSDQHRLTGHLRDSESANEYAGMNLATSRAHLSPRWIRGR